MGFQEIIVYLDRKLYKRILHVTLRHRLTRNLNFYIEVNNFVMFGANLVKHDPKARAHPSRYVLNKNSNDYHFL